MESKFSKISNFEFEYPNDNPIVIEDYFENKRNLDHTTPGPFEKIYETETIIKIWLK